MKKLIAALFVLGLSWWFLAPRIPLPDPPEGIRVSRDPAQTDTFTPAWQEGEFTIRPLARYDIAARVLGKKRYLLEEVSGLAPYDLALGWGVMSDSKTLKHVSVTQGGRWYEYTYGPECPVPAQEIARHSANVHCLPADPSVRRALSRLRVNAFVELRGYLVEVTHPENPQPWTSSLVRDDEGAGACEIFWITDVTETPH